MKKVWTFLLFAGLLAFAGGFLLKSSDGKETVTERAEQTINKSQLSRSRPQKKENPQEEFVKKLLSDFSLQFSLFKQSTLENNRYVYKDRNITVIFTVDPLFQKAVEKEFKRFRVKYGAYVAIDADTGKVLAAVSSTDYPDLTFKRTFPAASTFKIVTAAAALETGLATPNTEMVCGGTGDSCSPSVWLNSRYKVKRRFAESFATSANPFFGNLGRLLGKETLLEFARKFGFNRKDYGFPWGILREPLDDYDIALTAAGLGETRTSPFHQALIASVIENEGIMVKPTLIEKVLTTDGRPLYTFRKELFGRVVSVGTARAIREMMLLTVKQGTVSDKRHFRRLRRFYPRIVIGGKTGTLSELTYPEGRCEWFTGFMEYNGRHIAFSSLAVNNHYFYITGYEIAAVASADFAKLYRNFAVRGR
ncbi:penicillin-binding transpeptidase domain-containing protein [Phorcysia thermohydrogeniphila]|uniref:Penicillin binding protein n=1 Tax=Phorcysia thermohydrogeniphila TaxID=936138 RepID=A0A4R1GKT0_9BACT|nr:penicillin-binding transpeptidase domain-containing protein [Phorcysia thermohydrogeniphila]TCK06679.1 penicillin binding protein [Phorcysia thermohydrogeniphila]